MKPVIGIVSSIGGFDGDDPFKDRYYALNNYSKKLVNEGMVPISLLFDDEKVIEEALDLCDGFVFPGGKMVRDYHFKVLEYAIKNNKPVIGTCMGMQVMAMYSFKQLDESKILYEIEPLLKHWPFTVTRENMDTLVHNVEVIDKNSYLYEIFNNDLLKVNSIHRYAVKGVGPDFKITALAEDKVVEGVEYANKDYFIVGVQWHPEIMDTMHLLWDRFRIECTKRM